MPVDPFPYPNEIYPQDWFRRLGLGEIFPERTEAPFEIDLGCGDGGFLVDLAQAFPERNFLGVDRLLGRCRKVWRKSAARGLGNVKILRLDTRYAVRFLLPLQAASRIHFLCPDPWPKKKHASRRQMCQPEFQAAVHSLLAPSGEWLFKTDSADYFEEVESQIGGSPLFVPMPWGEDDFFYPRSDFETQWLAAGRTIYKLRLLKIGPSSVERD